MAQCSLTCDFIGGVGWESPLAGGLPGEGNVRFWNHDLCSLCGGRGASRCGLSTEQPMVPRGAPNPTRCPCFPSLSGVDGSMLPAVWKVTLRMGA